MDEAGDNNREPRVIKWKVITIIVIAEIFVKSSTFCYGILYSGFVLKEYFTEQQALWPIILHVSCSCITYPWMKAYCKQLYKNNRRLTLKLNELIISTIGFSVSILSSGVVQNFIGQCLCYGICGGIFAGVLSAKLRFYCENFIVNDPTIYQIILQLPKLISFGLISIILHFINSYFGPFITQLIWGCCCTNLLMLIMILDRNLEPITQPSEQQQQQQQQPQQPQQQQQRSLSNEQIEMQDFAPQNAPSTTNGSSNEENQGTSDDTNETDVRTTSSMGAADEAEPNLDEVNGDDDDDDDNGNGEIENDPEQGGAQPTSVSHDSEFPILHRIINGRQQSIIEYLPKALKTPKFYPLLITNIINLLCLIFYITLLPYIVTILQYEDGDSYQTTGTLVVPNFTSILWTGFVVALTVLRFPQLKTPFYLFVAALSMCVLCTAFLLDFTKFTIWMCCIPFGCANAILMLYEAKIYQQYIGYRNWRLIKEDLSTLTGVIILIFYVILYPVNLPSITLIKFLPFLYLFNLGIWVLIFLHLQRRRIPA